LSSQIADGLAPGSDEDVRDVITRREIRQRDRERNVAHDTLRVDGRRSDAAADRANRMLQIGAWRVCEADQIERGRESGELRLAPAVRTHGTAHELIRVGQGADRQLLARDAQDQIARRRVRTRERPHRKLPVGAADQAAWLANDAPHEVRPRRQFEAGSPYALAGGRSRRRFARQSETVAAALDDLPRRVVPDDEDDIRKRVGGRGADR
jgi:hypothetical protein